MARASSRIGVALVVAASLLVAAAPLAGAAGPPVNDSIPTVTGTPAAGETLTADSGEWSGSPSPTFSYQWQRCEEGPGISEIFAEVGAGPSGIAIDAAGFVYTANSGSTNVSRVSPDGTSSILASVESAPFGIALDSEGNAYTANAGSYNVSKITPGGVSTTLSGTGSGGAYALTVDPAGFVYTANIGSNDVSKISPLGIASILGSTGTYPNGIVLDDAGNAYTANLFSDNVSKIEPDGTSTIFATVGDGPYGIAIDSEGNLYTANSGDNNVSKIAPDGTATVLGTTGQNPFSVAVDPYGNVYSANFTDDNVTKITPDGQSFTLGSTGGRPYAIALDADGDVYTANSSTNDITRMTNGLTCVDIDQATGTTYSATAADVGKKLRVSVTATNSEGDATAESAPTEYLSGPPVNTIAPSVSGDPLVGQTLNASPGFWSGYPSLTFAIEWQRCEADSTGCVTIEGETGTSYVTTGGDVGKRIRAVVTGTNSVGSATANSNQTEPVAGPPVAAIPAAVFGSATVGLELTADPGEWSGYPAPSFSYSWLLCDAEGFGCTEISGATGPTYVTVAGDQGRKIRVLVTATNSAGSDASLSAPTGPIAPARKPMLGTLLSGPVKTRIGRSFTVTLKVRNRAAVVPAPAANGSSNSQTTATALRSCLQLPLALRPVKARGARVKGRSICWSRSSLGAGQAVTYRASVRAVRSGRATLKASLSASNVSGGSPIPFGSLRIRIRPA